MNLLTEALRARPHHLSPFLVLGDPDLERCVELAVAAVHGGATMLELGVPFSDPCADGPAIQRACARALAAGTTLPGAFAALAAIAERAPEVPRNLLVYGNLVHARGLRRFCAEAVAAGATSLLVPDMPFGEDGELRGACSRDALPHVTMIGARTRPDRIAAAAAGAQLLYVTAMQGVTGGAADDAAERRELVARVRAVTPVPVCLGFGLRTARHVAEAFAAGAQVAVVGSELVRVIEAGVADGGSAPDTRTLCSAFQNAVARLVPASTREV